MGNYKEAFYFLLIIWIITLGAGSYCLIDINKTLTNIQKQMDSDVIESYVNAGWVAPVNFVKTLRKKRKK